MSIQVRVDRGVPAGGQFTHQRCAEPTASLARIRPFSAGMIHTLANLDHPHQPIELDDSQIEAVNLWLGETGDFSARALRQQAAQLYLEKHGYTRQEYSDYLEAHGDNSAAFGDPHSVRRDIEQMRKDRLAA